MFTKFSTYIISITVLLALSFTVIADEPPYTTTTMTEYQQSKMRSDLAYLETYNIHELYNDPLWNKISGDTESQVLFPHHLAFLETYGIYQLDNNLMWTDCKH